MAWSQSNGGKLYAYKQTKSSFQHSARNVAYENISRINRSGTLIDIIIKIIVMNNVRNKLYLCHLTDTKYTKTDYIKMWKVMLNGKVWTCTSAC